MSDLRETKVEGTREIIRLYVIQRFDENPALEKEWDTPIHEGGVVTRTLDSLMSYIRDKARELPADHCCVAVEDKVVFGWVNHFLEEEARKEIKVPASSDEEEPKDEEAPKTVAKAEEAPKPAPKKAKKKAEEQGTQLALFSML